MVNSTNRTLATFIAVMLAVLGVIIAAGIGGVKAVDVIRGYAIGGTYYAKGHLTAVAALRRYAATGGEEHYYRYKDDIYVPFSDGVARDILEQPDIAIGNSYPFLIGGRNHPNDVPSIAAMYRLVGTSALFRPAVAIWRDADVAVHTLDALADQLRRSWTLTPGDTAGRIQLLARIDAVDARLIELEDRFAWQLGEAARLMARGVYIGLGLLGLALASLVVVLGHRTHCRLTAAQRAIRDSEERFRDVAELAADWIWETDAEHRFLYLSDRAEVAVGEPKARFMGQTRFSVAKIEDPESWSAHLADLAARRPFHGFDYAYLRRTGELRHFRISGRPVLDANGGFIGYRGTGTDVTDEVTSRREIAEKTVLLETIFDNVAQGVSVVDADLRIVAFNKRFRELLDLPPDRFRWGDPFEAFVRYCAERGEYGAGDVDTIVERIVESARRFDGQTFERVRPDGTVLEIRGGLLPEGGFVATFTNVTDRRRAACELHDAKVAAETASHAKSAFLANMSHELRTPLNAIIGFSDLMAEERFGALTPRYAGYARDIRQSGEHLLAVINDILDITRVEAGKIELAVEPVDLRALIDGCFRMLRPRALDAGVTLLNEVAPDTSPILADRQRLRQVVLNLVGNAVKFSCPDAEVSVRHLDAGDRRGLQIVDRGIGMPADQIADAFEPFAQLHSGFGRQYEGAGLGLPLVRRFVELHGGTVEIESAVGSGTTVTVLFPREPGLLRVTDGIRATG